MRHENIHMWTERKRTNVCARWWCFGLSLSLFLSLYMCVCAWNERVLMERVTEIDKQELTRKGKRRKREHTYIGKLLAGNDDCWDKWVKMGRSSVLKTTGYPELSIANAQIISYLIIWCFHYLYFSAHISILSTMHSWCMPAYPGPPLLIWFNFYPNMDK